MFEVPSAQYFTEVRSEVLPQSRRLGFSDAEAVKGRVLGKEVDNELTAGLDQGSLFDMDLLSISRMLTDFTSQ